MILAHSTNALVPLKLSRVFLFSFLISLLTSCNQQPNPTGSFTRTIPPASITVPTFSITSFEVSTDSVSNEIIVDRAGDLIIFEISSPTGLGNAEITYVENGSWPKVSLRFHLRGLEKLNLSYSSTELAASISSTSPNPVSQNQIFSDGSEQEIKKTSAFWMDIKLISNGGDSAQIPLTNGFIQVELPQDFYQNNPHQLSISWIDFFR